MKRPKGMFLSALISWGLILLTTPFQLSAQTGNTNGTLSEQQQLAPLNQTLDNNATTAGTPESTPSLMITGARSYYNPGAAALNVVGEVVNQSPRPVSAVRIIVTAYDQSNQVIGVSWNWAAIDILQPGFTSPFGVSLYANTVPLEQIASYRVTVDWK